MLNRRGFLKALGIGAAALAVEPARKMWFVPSTAPVGSRVERLIGAPGTPLDEWRCQWRSVGSTDLTFSLEGTRDWFLDEPRREYWSKLPIGGTNGAWAEAQAEARLLIQREVRSREELAAMYPDPVDTEFGRQRVAVGPAWDLRPIPREELARMYPRLEVNGLIGSRWDRKLT